MTNDRTRTRVAVDVGGTFTDAVLVAEEDLTTAKVPTTADQSLGVVRAIEKACDRAQVDPATVDAFSHAMTVSVNAVLEGAGARTGLVTTEGFRDVLEVGRQVRPALYDLDAERPEPLVPRRRRYEVPERATVEGVESPPDREAVDAVADALADDGVESVAVSLLHAYAHPGNERLVAERLRDRLDVPVSASHEVLAEFREYERTATTVVDAYVTPTIDSYLGRLAGRAAEMGLPEPTVMQSNGGVAGLETVRAGAVRTLLSGPAAGVVGAGATAEGLAPEHDGLVTFDMGGTSSDVSLVREGDVERTTDAEIAGRPVAVPTVDVTTVGAGGGSIAGVDAGGALRVGPASAGADPGPACYDRGGTEPTVTDADVVLGYVGPDSALGGELAIDPALAREALAGLAARLDLPDDREPTAEAALGVYRVANATTSRAIRSVTVERGHDPRSFALVAFGGAGPMHAAALAADLDISTVVVPRACGVLSAYGLLAADETHDEVRTHRRPLADVEPGTVEAIYGDVREAALDRASDPGSARVERSADVRYAGQSFELTVPTAAPFDPSEVARRFHDAHERAYGYRMDEAVALVSLRVTATVPREVPRTAHDARGDAVVESREALFPGVGARETTVYRRAGLPSGEELAGPAVVEDEESTTVVPPSWSASVLHDGTLLLGVDDG